MGFKILLLWKVSTFTQIHTWYECEHTQFLRFNKKKKTRVNGAEQWSNRSINWHCHIGGIVRMGEWAFVRACAAVKHWNICLKALLHLNQAKYVRSLFLNGPSNIRSTISESNYCVGIAQKKNQYLVTRAHTQYITYHS